jgi:hypothetical protein
MVTLRVLADASVCHAWGDVGAKLRSWAGMGFAVVWGTMLTKMLLVGLVGLVAGTGCASYDVDPPGTEGCSWNERDDATIFVEYRVAGGLAGFAETSFAHVDGKVEVQPDGDGLPDVSERGAEAAEGLRDALDESGVFDIDQGCYRAEEIVEDGIGRMLFLRDQDGNTYLFRTVDGADVPDELEDAMGLVQGYFEG